MEIGFHSSFQPVLHKKLPRLYRIIAPHYAVVHYILLTQNYRSLCSVLLRRFASLQPTQNPLDSSPRFSSNIVDFGQNKSEDKPRFNFDNKSSPGCLAALALNVPTCFASKKFFLFAKALRTLLACAGLFTKLVRVLTLEI